jgi:hypothetical protein
MPGKRQVAEIVNTEKYRLGTHRVQQEKGRQGSKENCRGPRAPIATVHQKLSHGIEEIPGNPARRDGWTRTLMMAVEKTEI